eukprot:m.451162 g.451162  ORF g.451162 m.451162 type:complete len:56 (-) comp20108_c0_seq1:22-189(-)
MSWMTALIEMAPTTSTVVWHGCLQRRSSGNIAGPTDPLQRRKALQNDIQAVWMDQ